MIYIAHTASYLFIYIFLLRRFPIIYGLLPVEASNQNSGTGSDNEIPASQNTSNQAVANGQSSSLGRRARENTDGLGLSQRQRLGGESQSASLFILNPPSNSNNNFQDEHMENDDQNVINSSSMQIVPGNILTLLLLQH